MPSIFKTVLVLGATGNTGFPLVNQLLSRGYNVVVIVRSLDRFSHELLKNPKLKIINKNLLDLSHEQLLDTVKDCGSIISCLGHTMNLKGIFGEPRALVLEAVKRVCIAIKDNEIKVKKKFLLMNTVGNRNPGENVTISEKFILYLLRHLIPPHHDNEAAAAYLRDEISLENKFVEWVVIRPDSLINGEISDYEVVKTPPRTIFNGIKTTRSNVAHFMCECVENQSIWDRWKGKMPVIFDK